MSIVTRALTSHDPRTAPDAYITDGKRLLRALCELDEKGRWAYEDCLKPAGPVVLLDVEQMRACRLVRRVPAGA